MVARMAAVLEAAIAAGGQMAVEVTALGELETEVVAQGDRTGCRVVRWEAILVVAAEG